MYERIDSHAFFMCSYLDTRIIRFVNDAYI